MYKMLWVQKKNIQQTLCGAIGKPLKGKTGGQGGGGDSKQLEEHSQGHTEWKCKCRQHVPAWNCDSGR